MYKFENSSLPLDERINDLISQLTADEKISFLPSSHPAVERLGLKEFDLGGEGAHGLVHREGGLATVFPQPFGLSMTWDMDLMKKIGSVIGDEARVYYLTKGRNSFLLLFFPTIDMERDPRWGRNEEAYGEDPFLSGKLSTELIKGAQGDHPFFLKIATCPKHFYANNYELERTYINSVLDERLKNEYYLRVFAYAFEEGKAASLMTAYNAINGIPGMTNPELDSLLRAKWGAESIFLSDGGAFGLLISEHKTYETPAESAAAAVKAGLDIFLDSPALVIDAATDAYKRGLLTDADLNKAMFNQLKIYFRLGVYGKTPNNPYEKIPESSLCSKENALLAKQAALESVVLLKNDGFLPIDNSKNQIIAVIGMLGNENMPDWYSGNPPYQITPLEGIRKEFPKCEVLYEDSCDTVAFFGKNQKKWLRVNKDNSLAWDGTEETRTVFKKCEWGNGAGGFKNLETNLYLTTTPEGELVCGAESIWGWFCRELFFFDEKSIFSETAHGDPSADGVAMRKGSSVYFKPYKEGCVGKVNDVLNNIEIITLESGIERAARAAKGADTVILVQGNHSLIDARECIDRNTLDFPKRFQALFESVSGVNKNIVLAIIAGYPYAAGKQEAASRAVLFTAHGAQEIGSAIGETLSGTNNPSGKLSMTWYGSDSVLPDINDYNIAKNRMTYLYHDKPVLHEFGFGMSYSAFEYSELKLKTEKEKGITAEFKIKNTGNVKGTETAQVYYTRIDPGFPSPLKQLAGFCRRELGPGEEKQVSIFIPAKEFYHYDTAKKDFIASGCDHKISIGASSLDIRLEGKIGGL